MTNRVHVNQDKAPLFKKILNVMSKVERIPKNGYNSFHKYAYTTESDLVEAARSLMVEEGLILFNDVREYEIAGDIATVTIDFTLCDVDTGESISTCIVGQGADKGDKAFYKALTGATKYYLMKTFLIPTGEDPEADVGTDQRYFGNQALPNYNQPNSKKNQSKNQSQGTGSGGNPKPVSEKQLTLINQRIQEVVSLINQDEEAIIHSLKERVGDFNQLTEMTSFQASKCIENLTKWKSSYSNRVQ